ncbi:MAG TPA: hypothetical protein P5110_09845 [Candidatus Omnitrophota bacterium]|nr:hypothetical protein [Candidatus Omnitrophota bacterium]
MNIDMETTSQPEFKICFGGKPNRIDAATLAQNLDSIGNMVAELNRIWGDGEKPNLYVKGTVPGSFIVDLYLGPELSRNIEALALFAPASISLAFEIIGAIADFLSIRKHLKKGKPTKVTDQDGSVIISNCNNVNITVNKKNYLIYSENIVINRMLDKQFNSLNHDPAVSSFEMRDFKDDVIFETDKHDFPEMSSGAIIAGEAVRRVVKRTIINIIKVSFETNLKWNVVFGGLKIGAYLRDDEFWDKVNSHDESFSKGDSLDVDIQIDQVWDQGLNTYLSKTYNIIKVYSHTKAGKQQAFPL